MIMEGLKSKVQLSNKMSPNFPDKKGGLLGKMVTTGSDCPAHQLILPFNAPLSITSPHSTLFSIRRFYITFTPKTQNPYPLARPTFYIYLPYMRFLRHSFTTFPPRSVQRFLIPITNVIFLFLRRAYATLLQMSLSLEPINCLSQSE